MANAALGTTAQAVIRSLHIQTTFALAVHTASREAPSPFRALVDRTRTRRDRPLASLAPSSTTAPSDHLPPCCASSAISAPPTHPTLLFVRMVHTPCSRKPPGTANGNASFAQPESTAVTVPLAEIAPLVSSASTVTTNRTQATRPTSKESRREVSAHWVTTANVALQTSSLAPIRLSVILSVFSVHPIACLASPVPTALKVTPSPSTARLDTTALATSPDLPVSSLV
jgi:hypothetical protein